MGLALFSYRFIPSREGECLFFTVLLVLFWTNGRTDRKPDGQTDGQMDGQALGRMDGLADKQR